MTGGIRTLELEERGNSARRDEAASDDEGPSYLDAEERGPVGPRRASPAVDGLVGPGWPAGGANADEHRRTALREYLVGSLGTAGPRPRDGTEVRVTLEPGDVERARRALRTFARRPGVYDPLALAATSLDVALQDLLRFVRDSGDPVTVSLDRWDCALVQFAAGTVSRDPADGDLALDPTGRGPAPSRLDLRQPR